MGNYVNPLALVIGDKHFGPGLHPGTGTPQEVHAGGDEYAARPHSAMDHVPPEWSSPNGLMNQFAARVGMDKKKLISLYTSELDEWRKSDPETYAKARDWYFEARDYVDGVAKQYAQYGVTPEQVAAVLSLTSAASQFETQNKDTTVGFLDIMLRENPETTLKRAVVEEFIEDHAKDGIDRSSYLDLFEGNARTAKVRLSDVPSEIIHLVPLWEERSEEGSLKRAPYWSGAFVRSAQVLRGESPWNVINGLKQRSFLYNIIYPGDPDAVTIDRWMLRAAALDARLAAGAKIKQDDGKYIEPLRYEWELPNGDKFRVNGSMLYKAYLWGAYSTKHGIRRVRTNPNKKGTPYNPGGMYLWHADWVEKVAKNMGVLPSQAQALIWTLVRDRKSSLLSHYDEVKSTLQNERENEDALEEYE